MIAFEHLEPEDLAEIKGSLAAPEGVKTFLKSVKSFLRKTPVDGGADSDLIYLVGKRLARYGIWDEVPQRLVAATLQDVPKAAVDLLLESAHPAFRQNVQPAEHAPKRHRHGRVFAQSERPIRRKMVAQGKLNESFVVGYDPKDPGVIKVVGSKLRGGMVVGAIDPGTGVTVKATSRSFAQAMRMAKKLARESSGLINPGVDREIEVRRVK